MNADQLLNLSSNVLFIAFILLLIAIFPFGLAVKSSRKLFERVGLALTYAAFLLQLTYFLVRWMAVGHAPVSNMYEFMTFFGIMLTGSTLILYHLYKQTIVALFSLPVSLIIIGYGGVFAKEVSPLVPSLQSNWLAIHVITVAFSSAILSVAFATGIIYLLRVLDVHKKTTSTRALELVLYGLVVTIGFIGAATIFSVTMDDRTLFFEGVQGQEKTIYSMFPLIVNDGALTAEGDAIGLVEIPNSIEARKLNTIVWAFIFGTALYALIRLITRKSLAILLKPLTNKVNPALMDEISYRAVVIGYPLFALGGLMFAMIWAQIAWGRYWGGILKRCGRLLRFYFMQWFYISVYPRGGKGNGQLGW